MFEVVILNLIPPLTQQEYSTMLPLLSAEEKKKIKRFHYTQDVQNCLLGHVLARIEICRQTGILNNDLKFSTNEFGKPFLVNDNRIHFNISHSGHYVACTIADEPVGIDIELIKMADLKIVERFFTIDEREYVLTPQDDLVTRRFFEVWTMKESRIKWEGVGLSKPLSSFSVFDPGELGEVYYHQILNGGNVICNVCSSIVDKPVVRMIVASMLVQSIM